MFPMLGLVTGIDNALKLTNTNVNDDRGAPATCQAHYRFNSNGNSEKKTSLTGYIVVALDQWIKDEFAGTPAFDSSLYEAGYFGVTGTGLPYLSGPALDEYHSLLATKEWVLQKYISGFGFYDVTGTIKVREIANPSNEVTATLNLDISAEL